MLAAGAASMLASQLTDQALTASWRAAARKDPPEDPGYSDVDWRAALLWTAAVGAIIGVSEMLARHGAEVAWRRVTGRRPPRPRRRKRA